MRSLKIQLAGFLLLLVSGAALADLPDAAAWQFERIDSAEGLPHDAVYSIAQDRTGFLWFGTGSGLARYDGYRFESFHHETGDASSPSDTDIAHILADRSGLLWLGTWGGGLDQLHPDLEQFAHYRSDPEEPGRLRDDRVQIVFEDRRGTIWAGTFAGGLARFDGPKKGTFTVFRHEAGNPSSLPHDRVWGIAEDTTGALWIATSAGLAKLDKAQTSFEILRHDPADPTSLSHDLVRAVYVDRRGVLWVGTERGLNRYEPASKSFTRYLTDDRPAEHGRGMINDIYEDSRGGFWIGTAHGGLVLHDRVAGTFRHFLYDPTDPESLVDNDVRTIFEDRSQNLWIGTRHKGVSKLDLKPRKFDHVAQRADDPNGLHSPRVSALVEDAQGRLWVGTNGGLERYDTTTGRFERFASGDSPSRLPRPDIHWLYVAHDGQLWIAVWRGGLSRYLGDGQGFATLRHDPDDPASLASDAVTTMVEDARGDFWIGTNRGLSKLDRRTESFEHFRHDPQDSHTLGDNLVWALHPARSGGLWVGTDSGGLNRLDLATGRFERIQHDPANPASLSNNRIFTIHGQESGRLWIGTDRGLNERLEDGTFRHWDESDGFADASILGILSDTRSRLWLSTNQGLIRFDPETAAVRNYSPRDGLQSTPFNAGVALQRRDGRMLFGGKDGFNSFYPDRVIDNPHVPPIVLTAFKRFDNAVELQRPTALTRQIELARRDNVFTFEFAALDYTNPRENRFEYKLEGHDPDWIDAGTRTSASYAGVKVGNYVFRVKGSNSDAIWNEAGLTLDVKIKPPWWSSPWAYGLGLGLLLLMGALLVRHRQHRVQRREQKLEEKLEQGLAKLRRSEERYRKLFERNVAGVVRASPDGTILDCNNAFARLFGYASREECLALHELILTEDDERPLLEQLRDRDTYESTVHTLDGAEITLIWNASLVMDESNEGPVIEGTVIDISERRRIEERQRQEQKLESLEMLAGGVAHDLNNLLVGILGNADLARRETSASTEVGEFLDEIEDAAHRAASLAKKMLAYSGKGRFVASEIDLSEAVDQVLLMLTISKKVVIESYLDDGLPAVKADNTQINQLLTNLITNAIEAIAEKETGIVRITTGSQHCDRKALAETLLDEDLEEGLYVFVEVHDDGPGIAPEVEGKVFDPFVTTKLPGRGLGLPVVLGVVRGHRGALEFSSEPGQGTTVRVLLPAADVTAVTPTVAEDEAWSGSGKVLLVDDEALVRNIAHQMLQILGFEVLTASDGDEGVELFRQHFDEINLVVLDLSMPRMGGEEAFQEIRRIRPDARVLLASGYEARTAMERFEGQGLAGFIQKPYQLASFREKVRQAFIHQAAISKTSTR